MLPVLTCFPVINVSWVLLWESSAAFFLCLGLRLLLVALDFLLFEPLTLDSVSFLVRESML